jgi:prevent-host-death family protein
MQKQIDVIELGQRAAAVIAEVARQQEPVIVARDGEPAVVLLSYVEFLRLRPVSDEDVHARFDRLLTKMDRLNAGVSEEEVARDVAEAIAEVRRGDP